MQRLLTTSRVLFGAVLVAIAAAVLAHPATGQANANGAARTLLAAEIARLESDIAALDEQASWQREMIRAAASDPAGTLRQRRPMAQCLASPLAPVCGVLTALFREETTAAESEGRNVEANDVEDRQ